MWLTGFCNKVCPLLLLVFLAKTGHSDTFTINPSPTPFYVPPYVPKGKDSDREFDGNGPSIDVEVKLTLKKNEIWANVRMSAKETKRNWTKSEGSRDFLVYRHSKNLKRIVSNTTERYRFIDTDHENDKIKGRSIVRSYEFVGDRKGHDAGIHTGVRIYFNPITVEGIRGTGEKPGVLKLKWMGVIDNGEGVGGWHGPKGNIHAELFDAKGDKLAIRYDVIPGPTEKEWVDLDQKSYGKGLILHKWAALDDSVSLKLWESDPGPGRKHDTLYYMTIRREATTGKVYLSYDHRLFAAPDVTKHFKKRKPPKWYFDKMKSAGLKKPPKLFIELVTE